MIDQFGGPSPSSQQAAKPRCSANTTFEAKPRWKSIRRVLFAPVLLIREWCLFLFIKDKVLQHQKIHFGSHETAIAIFWSADDWFTSHIKAGVHNHRTTCLLPKGFDDFPVKRICLAPHRLYSSRVINVRDRRDF